MNQKLKDLGGKVRNGAIRVKDWAVRNANNFLDWVIDNPETAAAIIVPTTVAAFKSGQSLIVSHRNKTERRRIDYTYYDPSTGFHWDLRRKPTNNDRMVIQSRKAQGQDTYKILNDLHLI